MFVNEELKLVCEGIFIWVYCICNQNIKKITISDNNNNNKISIKMIVQKVRQRMDMLLAIRSKINYWIYFYFIVLKFVILLNLSIYVLHTKIQKNSDFQTYSDRYKDTFKNKQNAYIL